jgi:ectoine hydroxylase-related dioxygenase (phytanoyl-CoA dioxygenase family)
VAYFTDEDKAHFKDQGYVVKHDVVSASLIDRAVDVLWEEIEADRNDPKTWINAGPKGNLKCGSHPDVRATLSDTPIQAMCEELVGPDSLRVSNHTFVKMIYPEGHDNWTTAQQMHLDGYTCEGVHDAFTIAVTVNINHIKPRSGGFTIWPESHKRAHAYFREHSLTKGLDAFRGPDGAYENLPDPIDVTGPPGTVTFWHNLMLHSPGVNCGRDIRMAFVSRFTRKDINEIRFEFPEDMWTYWDGL